MNKEKGKAKFTPGPWDGDSRAWHGLVVMSEYCQVSDIGGGAVPSDEQKANAALIASAPDMYAALEKAVAEYGKEGGPWNVPNEPGSWVMIARAALAKARGKTI